MASACSLQFLSLPSQWISSSGVELRTDFGLNYCRLNSSRTGKRSSEHQLVVTACSKSAGDISKNYNDDKSISNLKKPTQKFKEIVDALPPIVLMVKRQSAANFLLTFCIATTCLIIAVRIYVVKRSKYNRPGTVADLVRRGQLRTDRRGISKPLKYEDPFNNPLMKVGKGNSTVEMCGKVYRLAPVTLTEELQAIHQKRRSRAYQWKRPKVFLKEGESIPPDVDPDTIRWIPANHPFATTASDIDEDLAQNNVYQKHGVPFRIQAEHEALQRKLEALQNEQKLNNLVIDPVNAKDFERAFKAQLRSHEQVNQSPQNGQVSDSKAPKSDQGPESFDSSSASG